MGTNFYLYVDVCNCCGRPEKEVHLGKRSFGWTFGIQGFNGLYEFDGIFRGFLDEHKIGSIKSWRTWKKIFSKMPKNWKIVDEYGRVVDKKEFIQEVEESYKDKEKLKHASEYYSEKDYLDDEGYSISEHHFS